MGMKLGSLEYAIELSPLLVRSSVAPVMNTAFDRHAHTACADGASFARAIAAAR